MSTQSELFIFASKSFFPNHKTFSLNAHWCCTIGRMRIIANIGLSVMTIVLLLSFVSPAYAALGHVGGGGSGWDFATDNSGNTYRFGHPMDHTPTSHEFRAKVIGSPYLATL